MENAKRDVQPITQGPKILGLLANPIENASSLLKTVLGRYKPATMRVYAKAWVDFAAFLRVSDGGSALRKLLVLSRGEANALVFEYRTTMEKDALSPQTVSVRLAGIKAIVYAFYVMGASAWKLDVPTPRAVVYRDTRGPGTQAVLDAITKLKDATDPKLIRDFGILCLLYLNGLRRNEVATLDVDHIDLEGHRLLILRKGKRGDDRKFVSIGHGVERALKRWLAVHPLPEGGSPLFTNYDPTNPGARLTGGSIWRITKALGLGHPHGIRHASITEVYRKTKDPLKTKEFAGHLNMEVLKHYIDNLEDLAGEASNLLDQDIQWDSLVAAPPKTSGATDKTPSHPEREGGTRP